MAAQPLRDDAPCADENLVVAVGFDDDWARAIDAACGSLKGIRDRDAQAILEISPSGSGAQLRVQLGDGRTAERALANPEDLAETMEALLTLPPSARAKPTEAPAALAAKRPATNPSAAREPESEGTPIAFDVAALATGRILGERATLGPGIVVSANLDIDEGWLVGARLRVDPALFVVGRDNDLIGGAFGGGVELGRRVRVGPVALDFGLGADGLGEVPYGDDHRSGRDANGDLRTRAFSKLWVSGRGLSFTGLLGFEISPPRLAAEDSESSAPGPAYGAELGAGLGWSGP